MTQAQAKKRLASLLTKVIRREAWERAQVRAAQLKSDKALMRKLRLALKKAKSCGSTPQQSRPSLRQSPRSVQ